VQLCDVCNSANGNAFENGSDCHVCGGKAMRLHPMIEDAAKLARAEAGGAESFAISTIIPKEWLVREEDVWDRRCDGCESIKNMLNRTIAAALRKSTGLNYWSEGGLKLVFDFESGRVALQRNELFVFGRYKKRVAGLSQSRWLCAKCEGKGCKACEGKGKNYESVEERIGEPFKAAAGADAYVLHASGREDIDATNSAGRPFVLELAGARERKPDLVAMAEAAGKSNDVSVHDLHIVPRSFVEVVTESHFDKAYEADVEFGREIGEEDAAKVRTLEGQMLLQQTPNRVAHRRADLVRHRRVKRIEMVRRDVKNKNMATLVIKAEAGTYIKELISGDGGRTKPNVAELLGIEAKCKKLEVIGIDDGYMDFCLSRLA